jgi:hypothetical protein
LGLLMGVAGLATPAPFAVLSRAEAGRVVGRVLAGEARARLALGAVLLRLEQREAKARATVGTGSRFSGSMVLALGAISFLAPWRGALRYSRGLRWPVSARVCRA